MPLRKRRLKNGEVTRIAYKYLALPDVEQKIMFAKTFGCVRYLYNRMLDDKIKAYKYFGENLYLTPAWYKHISCCRWLSEVDSNALCTVMLNLNDAYNRYFKGKAKYPKFKKKSDHRDSYTTYRVKYRCTDQYIYLSLPKVPGELLIRKHRPFKSGGTLKSVTVSREPNGKYYVSLLFEYAKQKTVYDIDPDNSIGLDMSMHGFYVDSNGETVDTPHPYLRMQERIAKEQRKLSHMKRGSSNYKKQKKKIGKLYAKAKQQRYDFLHKMSRKLVDTYDIIGIEDLNMHGMSQALNFGKSVADKGWGIFTKMLCYKAEAIGKRVIQINKWYPSSQTCNECGYIFKQTKDLSVREWVCPNCGCHHDRDINAAINIRNEAVRIYCTQ